MPRVARVTSMGMDYGYMFVVSSLGELLDWFEAVRLNKSREELADAVQSKEVLGSRRSAQHAREGSRLAVLTQVHGGSVIDALSRLNQDLMEGMQCALRNHGTLLINGAGGWFFPIETTVIDAEQEVADWVLPDQSFRIIQWPNGTHFYVKQGEIDIVVDGKQKWDTRYEAERAIDKWKRGYRK
jgi:hypothetical protein